MKAKTTKKEQKKVQNIDDIIISLKNKDLTAYRSGEKSFELLNWLKDELLLRQLNNSNTMLLEVRTLNYALGALSWLREKHLNRLTIDILDSKTTKIDFEFDMSTLSRGQIAYFNRQYGENLPLPSGVDEVDEFDRYEHFV